MNRRGWFAFVLLLWFPREGGASEWPVFRGPDSDGAYRGETSLGEMETVGLKVLWKRPLGSGYSGVSVASGRAVTCFSDGTRDVAAAWDAATGEEVWRFPIGPTYRGHDGSHDGPVATPLVVGGLVYALSPHGELFALDLETGEKAWSTHLGKDHEAMQPIYGFGASPIFMDGVVVVAAGAHGDPFVKGPTGAGPSILGLDAVTGELRWRVGKDTVNYQSPMPATVGGQRLVLAATDDHLFGIVGGTGETLWQVAHGGVRYPGPGNPSMQPVAMGPGRFLLTNTPDHSVAVAVTSGDDGLTSLRRIWSSRSIRGSYAVPLFHDGYLYAYSKSFLTCVDAATGEGVWRSRMPGDGFPILVDGHLVIMTKKGGLHVAEARPDEYREVASLALFSGGSWTAPSFAGGRIYARSLGAVAAVELTADAATTNLETVASKAGRFGRFLAEIEAASDKPAAVDRFLASLDSIPMIESDASEGDAQDVAVHFLYRGEGRDVAIAGDLIQSRSEQAMTRVAGTKLFYYSTRLLADARVSYHFIKDFEERMTDPLNPRRLPDLEGEVSWVGMPRWRPPDHLEEAPEARRGRLESHQLGDHQVDVYLPAGYDAAAKRRYPVVYVHGGRAAMGLGSWTRTLDNVVGRSVDPVLVVFIHSNDPWQEFLFRARDAYAAAFAETIVPAIDSKYPTLGTVDSRASVGAGAAGYAALYCAFQQPGLVGRVASQSAFMLTLQVMSLQAHVKTAEEQPLAVFLEWGTYDMRSEHEAWDHRVENRRLAEFFQSRGYPVTAGEVPEGHGWSSWRNRNDQVLEWLFPLM